MRQLSKNEQIEIDLPGRIRITERSLGVWLLNRLGKSQREKRPIILNEQSFSRVLIRSIDIETKWVPSSPGDEWIAGRGGFLKRAKMTTPTTPEYLLLFRGTDYNRGLSPEELQNLMNRWIAWFDRLTEQGKARAGQPLTDQGKVISGKKGQTVLDGPFAESKESIAGYILIQVNNLDEAVEIAKECPGLDYGVIVEVRQVDQPKASLFAINMVTPFPN
jgi:hypothetical protein